VLVQQIEALRNDVEPNKVDAALKWLDSLYAKRQQWAAPWTWQHGTLLRCVRRLVVVLTQRYLCLSASFGVHSTQRAESMHWVVKSSLGNQRSVKDLLEFLVDYHKHRRECHDAKVLRRVS
jgi:hypothetical protein